MDLKEKLGMAIHHDHPDLGIVARMCEKIAVMYAGKIVRIRHHGRNFLRTQA